MSNQSLQQQAEVMFLGYKCAWALEEIGRKHNEAIELRMIRAGTPWQVAYEVRRRMEARREEGV